MQNKVAQNNENVIASPQTSTSNNEKCNDDSLFLSSFKWNFILFFSLSFRCQIDFQYNLLNFLIAFETYTTKRRYKKKRKKIKLS